MSLTVFRNKVYHSYKMGFTPNVIVCVFDDGGKCAEKAHDFGENIGYPFDFGRKWRYHARAEDLLLYAGSKWLNISGGQIIRQEDFAMEIPEEVWPHTQVHIFGNTAISFPTERTIACTDLTTKETLWKHALKGYPYTAIEQKDDYILFGTAGHGGALYCINARTGKILRSVSTKGTVHYCWHEDFVLMKDEHGHLQATHPFSDKQVGVLKLKNRLVDASPMIVHNKRLYAVTFSNTKKNGADKTPYITCFALDNL